MEEGKNQICILAIAISCNVMVYYITIFRPVNISRINSQFQLKKNNQSVGTTRNSNGRRIADVNI